MTHHRSFDMQMMPPISPLARPIQNLNRPFRDASAPGPMQEQGARWRLAAFGPALLTVFVLGGVFIEWFRPDGLLAIELILVALICATFFWVAFSVSTATIGLINVLTPAKPQRPATPVRPLNVALLVPIYNEVPCEVFGNATAMLEDLQRLNQSAGQPGHRYTLFILSDTQDQDIAAQELRGIQELRSAFPNHTGIYYRRRQANTDNKTGNLADWVEHWGGAYEAMLVLDADSLLTADATVELTDALSTDSAAGLIQSFPQVFDAHSLFGRIQQFSSTVYGNTLSEGLAKWSGQEGNFWGHNAILRTAAFASCAGLPHIPSIRAAKTMILSHDFVEAGLLRRAGWTVRFMPSIKGSYEQVPQTLIDYAIRDRRWCQGNMQHLRLLGTAGLHPVSRFHMLHGAVSYLMSVAWFTLLLFWAVLGNGEASPIRYFDAADPLFPVWPEMSVVNGWAVMLFMYSMLLVPKLMGLLSIRAIGLRAAQLGGLRRLAMSFVVEVIVSIIYAPILMVQQMIAVFRVLIGKTAAWKPQKRDTTGYPLKDLAKFHVFETVSGVLLLGGMAAGAVSLWLLPIAISLFFAIPLSALSGLDLSRWSWSRYHLGTPEVFDAPPVIRNALRYRAHLAKVLPHDDTDVVEPLAAE